MRFKAESGALPTIREALEHDEHLIRHLILKLDAKALAPAPAPRMPRPVEVVEVTTEPKVLERKHDVEKSGKVSDEELDKQIEDLIK